MLRYPYIFMGFKIHVDMDKSNKDTWLKQVLSKVL